MTQPRLQLLSAAVALAALGCVSSGLPRPGPASATPETVRVEVRNASAHAITVRAATYMDQVRPDDEITTVVRASTFGADTGKTGEEEGEAEVRWTIEVHASVAFVVHRTTRPPRAGQVVDIHITENPDFSTVSVR